MTDKPTVSICIPSYNRPLTLLRLLESIDAKNPKDLEIVIGEDCSPKRGPISETVRNFQLKSKYLIRYFENKINLGFDKNLKELIRRAIGDYVVFMGDDDVFEKDALDSLVGFLKGHSEIGYVLKSHTYFDDQNKAEKFRYYSKTMFFEPGIESYIGLFRKSVFISGFTIKREWAQPHLIGEFDGSLLFQLYLLAEVTLKYPSAYLDVPLTRRYGVSSFNFGNAETEKEFYTPGPVSVQNSLNFLSWYPRLTGYIDKKYKISSTSRIQKDMSKYFYPNLAIQRDKGLRGFFEYVRQLNQLGFNASAFYYLYIILLVLFGKRICDNGIRILKSLLGRTPRL
jgi:glycosyltransferase involved in cell wall biosynthesis